MVQFIYRQPSYWEQHAGEIGQGVGNIIGGLLQYQKNQQQQKVDSTNLSRILDDSTSPMQKLELYSKLSQDSQKKVKSFIDPLMESYVGQLEIDKILGGENKSMQSDGQQQMRAKVNPESFGGAQAEPMQGVVQNQQQPEMDQNQTQQIGAFQDPLARYNDEQLFRLSAGKGPAAKLANKSLDMRQKNRDLQQRAGEEEKKREIEERKFKLAEDKFDALKKKEERIQFKEERDYNTDFTKEIQKEVDQKRTSLMSRVNALDFARNAIESRNVSFFSPDKLADATGFDVFRTAKGAQLVTAGKENLLANMSRVSARGQNLWFEQRLNSMFPKIGQSLEANLTVQEMLEGETAIEEAYVNEYDRLVEQDEKQYGFVKKDIKKRVIQALKPIENEILNRTNYRMKELEEKENGLKSMKQKVGKSVPKGTPLTLAMAKLYKETYGEKAMEVAEKNGYVIPTYEEFQIYQKRPKEFREKLVNE